MKLGGIFAAMLVAGAALATPAAAVTNFYTSFDSLSIPVDGNGQGEQVVTSIEGWNSVDGIRVQAGGIHGDPNSTPNLVELDIEQNSSMFRTIDAGVYTLIYSYSPRPGNAENSNNIAVFFDGQQLSSVTQSGLGNTDWTDIQFNFTAATAGTLTFAAAGIGDGKGGYVDDVELDGTALPVPEPSEWAMIVAGLGVIGAVARRRRA